MVSSSQPVPTNIITGFLGVGKTTAILHLLATKPSHERWAVLVNEFGEIGIDGSLISSQFPESQGIYTKEVPGGCMCCAAGLPMHFALNQLLQNAQPHRLIIEPTGLGHPAEVLQSLSAPHYRDIISMHQILTLVDARKIKERGYTDNATFQQQLVIADRVIGNKQDLYSEEDEAALAEFLAEHGNGYACLEFTQNGQVSTEALDGPTQMRALPATQESKAPVPGINEAPLPDNGYLKAQNKSGGYESVGWRFSPTKVFNTSRLYSFLTGLNVERMKAIFITDTGVFGYNLTADTLTQFELDDCMESRIDIICQQVNEEWESEILNCIQNTSE